MALSGHWLLARFFLPITHDPMMTRPDALLLVGSTVILASRIAAQAGAGEILIPEPLRHLLSGKNYVYADRGMTALKGFEDPVRLYEVRWRE